MKTKIEARINASKISDFTDKLFSELYLNAAVEWDGEPADMSILEKRAKQLKLNKEKVR
jgi:hypothetical protein